MWTNWVSLSSSVRFSIKVIKAAVVESILECEIMNCLLTSKGFSIYISYTAHVISLFTLSFRLFVCLYVCMSVSKGSETERFSDLQNFTQHYYATFLVNATIFQLAILFKRRYIFI